MEVLGWLLIPLAALVLGLLWAAWRSRERKPVEADEGMEGLARFRQAMEKPLPDREHVQPPDLDDTAGPDILR